MYYLKLLVHIVVKTFNFGSARCFCFTDYGTELCCNARSLKLVCEHAHLFKISGNRGRILLPQYHKQVSMLAGYVKPIKLFVM